MRTSSLPAVRTALTFLALCSSLVGGVPSHAQSAETAFVGRCRTALRQLFDISSEALTDLETLHKAGQPPLAALNGASLRIVVWNTAKGKGPEWSADFEKLTEAADLSLLQEARVERTFFHSNDSGNKHEWILASGFRLSDGSLAGVMTGSRAKALRTEYLRTAHTEPLTKTPKMTLLTTYKLKGSNEPLLVVNVHGINFVRGKLFRAQLKQIEDAILKHRGPAILAGDFNSWSPGRMKSIHDMIGKMGFQSVTPEETGRILRLDHVFVRGLKSKSGTVDQSIKTSDHKPLLLELRLAE